MKGTPYFYLVLAEGLSLDLVYSISNGHMIVFWCYVDHTLGISAVVLLYRILAIDCAN